MSAAAKGRVIHNAPITATFLGTVSAAPSSTRRHSAMALRLGGDLWMFDCGESAQIQLQRSSLRMGDIEKVFITHTHGDHISGLVPLMCHLLNGDGGITEEGGGDPRLDTPAIPVKPLEIYGPLGTRAYIRNCLKYTYTCLGGPYVVHELRFPRDPMNDYTHLPLHQQEHAGRNIMMANGMWPAFYEDKAISVSACPIRHTVPCVGYVLQEAPIPGKIDPKLYIPHIKRNGAHVKLMSEIQQGKTVTLADGTVLQGPPKRPGRKLVILGDTHNPSAIAPFALDADLLVHEATNAHLPDILPDVTKEMDTYASVQSRTKKRGHSTPQMAGQFAQEIRAKTLILNHFSGRYAGNDDVNNEAARVMNAIRDLAKSKFDGEVFCARDLWSHDVVIPKE